MGSASAAQAVNQAPIVQLGPDIGVLERDLGYLPFDGWAHVLLPGPPSESGQALTVDVEVLGGTLCDENPGLSLEECAQAMFDIAPGIDPVTGTLAFATARNTDGTIRLRAVLRDDGGTAGGGMDTATADFTITLNRREPPADRAIRNPWRSSCVPVQVWVDGTRANKDDLNAWFSIDSLPSNGYLREFVLSKRDSGPTEDAEASWTARLIGSDITQYARVYCYIPFSPTFTGYDFFTYSYDDSHGGDPLTGVVSIEIFEQ